MGDDQATEYAVREMTADDEYFVGTCSHVGESTETDAACSRRLAFFREWHDRGLRVLVAHRNGMPAAFLYLMPIEISPWGPEGRGLDVVPCLYVPEARAQQGIGRGLLAAAERLSRERGSGGLVVPVLDHGSFWFMPAAYFQSQGYDVVGVRGAQRLVWKRFRDDAEPPRMLEPRYVHHAVPGKVVIDLFWNRFCLTSEIEAQRVREVATEFGEAVVLNEFHASDPGVLDAYGNPRAIYVNGEQITWGYEAPRDGIREAIRVALARL